MLLRPYEYDSIVQNPISEADFKWILHRNCEGTEQLRKKGKNGKGNFIFIKGAADEPGGSGRAGNHHGSGILSS